jgi:predicted NodU family carbamoyl transferase
VSIQTYEILHRDEAVEQANVEARLTSAGTKFSVISDAELIDRADEMLVSGHVVGWFQGRIEYGPRALGNRSILGKPRSPQMQSVLNLKIKYRESFRPFAPSVLLTHVAEWFELDRDSLYMLIVTDVARRHAFKPRPTTASSASKSTRCRARPPPSLPSSIIPHASRPCILTPPRVTMR